MIRAFDPSLEQACIRCGEESIGGESVPTRARGTGPNYPYIRRAIYVTPPVRISLFLVSKILCYLVLASGLFIAIIVLKHDMSSQANEPAQLAASLFSVNGIVALVTGGGSGRSTYHSSSSAARLLICYTDRYWPDDSQSISEQRGRQGLHCREALGYTTTSCYQHRTKCGRHTVRCHVQGQPEGGSRARRE